MCNENRQRAIGIVCKTFWHIVTRRFCVGLDLLPLTFFLLPPYHSLLKTRNNITLKIVRVLVDGIIKECIAHYAIADIRTFEVLLRTYEIQEGRIQSSDGGDESYRRITHTRRKRQCISSEDTGENADKATSTTTVMVRPCQEARGHTGYLTFARLNCQ